MPSNLKNLSPIHVGGETLPPPQLFHNIPMLHSILEDVLGDWLRVVKPYQMEIDNAEDESARLYATSHGFMDLQPSLLKCLFSYASFFVATDNAYGYLYKKLNRANHLLGLNLNHRKPPKRNALISKIVTIRDIAITHFPSEKASPIDAFAAMSWQPMTLSSSNGARPDLEKLTFGEGRFRGVDSTGQIIESRDLEVSGIGTAHRDHCMPYLNRYDEMCCEYLNAIHVALVGTNDAT